MLTGRLALHLGDHPTAKADLDLALDMARQGDPLYAALALEGLGQLATEKGLYAEARARLAEGLRLLDEIANRAALADMLESFGALAGRQSYAVTAFKLVGAAAALREAIGAVRAPCRADLLGQWLPVLRSTAGEDVATRQLATGRAMTMPEAIAAALGVGEPEELLSSAHEQDVSPRVLGLTSREADVLRLLAHGQSNKEIAAELVLSVRTVERHITNLYAKIGARGKADATAYAIHHDLT
jgi:non-specific serine/threonine protein kinase